MIIFSLDELLDAAYDAENHDTADHQMFVNANLEEIPDDSVSADLVSLFTREDRRRRRAA